MKYAIIYYDFLCPWFVYFISQLISESLDKLINDYVNNPLIV